MTNWATVQSSAIAAAQNVLEGSWGAVSPGATAQITMLVQTAQYIETNSGAMTPAETQFLMAQQKTALQNVLTAYISISIAIAMNVVSAIIKTIITAAPGLAGLI